MYYRLSNWRVFTNLLNKITSSLKMEEADFTKCLSPSTKFYDVTSHSTVVLSHKWLASWFLCGYFVSDLYVSRRRECPNLTYWDSKTFVGCNIQIGILSHAQSSIGHSADNRDLVTNVVLLSARQSTWDNFNHLNAVVIRFNSTPRRRSGDINRYPPQLCNNRIFSFS
jgi:hypothetical protein